MKFDRLMMYTASWNVNGRSPTEDLSVWLGKGDSAAKDSRSYDPDVYVIGLQEVDLSTSAYLSSRDRSGKLGEWMDAIGAVLSPRGFAIAGYKQLVGMVICVYTRCEGPVVIEDIECESYGTGLMNRVGNKGATVARIKIGNCWFLFVNCHLAHEQNAVEKRNKQFLEIKKRMRFDKSDEKNNPDFSIFRHLYLLGRSSDFEFEDQHKKLCGDGSEPPNSTTSSKRNQNQHDANTCPVLCGTDRGFVRVHNPLRRFRAYLPNTMHYYDYVVVLGDLNYRIDLDIAQTKLLIQEYNFETLINFDQLSKVRKSGISHSIGSLNEISPEDVFSDSAPESKRRSGRDAEAADKAGTRSVEEDEGGLVENDRDVKGSSLSSSSSRSGDDGNDIDYNVGLGVFGGLKEGDIAFVPTYKYDVGTQRFDTSEKQRCPAWCDRILFRSGGGIIRTLGNSGSAGAEDVRGFEGVADLVARSGNGNSEGGATVSRGMKQLWYCSHPDYVLSDHKPISAGFEMVVDYYDDSLLKEEHAVVLRMLDRLENECMPDAEINTNVLDFGTVQFMGKAIVRELVLENTGQVALNYAFVPKGAMDGEVGGGLSKEPVCGPWMWIDPIQGMLPRGGRVTIKFKVHVGVDTVPLLSTHGADLSDILVLHLENGKDMFVSIMAQFEASCFGKSLEYMANTRTPARLGSRQDLLDSSLSLGRTSSQGTAEGTSVSLDEENATGEVGEADDIPADEYSVMEEDLRRMTNLSAKSISNIREMITIDHDALELLLQTLLDGEILARLDSIVPDAEQQNLRSCYIGKVAEYILQKECRMKRREGEKGESTILLNDVLSPIELEATLNLILSIASQDISGGSSQEESRDEQAGSGVEEAVDYIYGYPIDMTMIPPEISGLVELTRREFLDTPHLFRSSGDIQEMAEIRAVLDTRRTVLHRCLPHPTWHAHSVAQTLLHLLEAIDGAVLPPLYGRQGLAACAAGGGRASCTGALVGLPQVNSAVFRYVVQFLDEVVAHGRVNGLTRQSASLVFGPVLIRTCPSVHVATYLKSAHGITDEETEVLEAEQEVAKYVADEQTKSLSLTCLGGGGAFLPAIHRLKSLFLYHLLKDPPLPQAPLHSADDRDRKTEETEEGKEDDDEA